jgi:uncharacterized membrane protein YesL
MAFFSPEGKFMRFMERLLDVLLLNLLWVVFSLPVITIGAATTAAFSVALKMVDDEEGPIARGFVKAFKREFLIGTLIWLLNAAAAYALYLDWQIVMASARPSVILIIVSILSTAFVVSVFLYAYPQAARYDSRLGKILSNSFRISFRFFGRTLFLAAVLLLEIGLFLWNGPMLVFGVLAGPMIILYTVSGVSLRIFQKIEAENRAGS